MIRDPRLLLRAPVPSDAAALHALFDDAEVMRHIGDGAVRDEAYYRSFVEREARRFREHGYCLATLLVDGEVAGFVGLHEWAADWGPTGELEIGWRLGRDFWGRGLARRAAQSVLDDRPDISPVAMIALGNERSERLAARLGFAPAEDYEIPSGGRARCHRLRRQV